MEYGNGVYSNGKDDVQLLVMTGLGEDERSSYPQLALPYRLIRPRYIEPHHLESTSSYCSRLADSIRPAIGRGPLFAVGISLGAVIVQEFAHHLPIRGVILVSGYRSSGELAPMYRFLGRHASLKVPVWAYKAIEPFAAIFSKSFADIPWHDCQLLQRMYRDFPKTWFREHERMAAEWKGTTLDRPTLRIHGSADPIVPYRGQADIDVLIEGDKHMCNLSHKDLVNDRIYRFVEAQLKVQNALLSD